MGVHGRTAGEIGRVRRDLLCRCVLFVAHDSVVTTCSQRSSAESVWHVRVRAAARRDRQLGAPYTRRHIALSILLFVLQVQFDKRIGPRRRVLQATQAAHAVGDHGRRVSATGRQESYESISIPS